ncbi:unnamed protein product [Ectocarpus sp. 13 AM-2016]
MFDSQVHEHGPVKVTPRRHEQHQYRPGNPTDDNLWKHCQPFQGHVLRCHLCFTASGPIIRMKCGIRLPACNSTCNPSTDLPISCNNKVTPHLHDENDMVPTLFTIIQPHMAVDCGPHTEDGKKIPSAISIGTKALEEVLMCEDA